VHNESSAAHSLTPTFRSLLVLIIYNTNFTQLTPTEDAPIAYIQTIFPYRLRQEAPTE